MCTAKAKRFLLALLAASVATSALAQSDAPSASTQPAGEAPLMPLPQSGSTVTPVTEAEGLSADTAQTAEMQRRAVRQRAVLQVLSLDKQIRDVREDLDLSAGSVGTPELIGIRGARDDLVAEFAVGQAVLEARPGEWVTGEYRLEQVLANGVVLKKRGERTPLTVLFGRRGEIRGNVLTPVGPAPVLTEPPPQQQ